MLVQSMCQPTSPFGLNLRLAYFCRQLHTFADNFFIIKGCFEVCAMDFDGSNLLSLPIGIILRFC
jgi:hypothetical protein